MFVKYRAACSGGVGGVCVCVGGGAVSKCSCVSGTPQLFSKSDRRSSLLLLGRSGGSRYERSSSGLASSGSSCGEERRNFKPGVPLSFHFFPKFLFLTIKTHV